MCNQQYLKDAEYETFYPRIMLEQRMNRNIKVIKGSSNLASKEFDMDLDVQI